MDGKLLECVVMALVCCVPLVKATNTNGTVNIFATIQDTGLRRWRNRRADTCRDIVHSFKDTQDISAQSVAKSGTTEVKAADATAWCLANTACTGYMVDVTKKVNQLLNGWRHRHQNRKLCSHPHTHESVIFFSRNFAIQFFFATATFYTCT